MKTNEFYEVWIRTKTKRWHRHLFGCESDAEAIKQAHQHFPEHEIMINKMQRVEVYANANKLDNE